MTKYTVDIEEMLSKFWLELYAELRNGDLDDGEIMDLFLKQAATFLKQATTYETILTHGKRGEIAKNE